MIINTYDQLMQARHAGMVDVAVVRNTVPSTSRSRPTFQTGWAIWQPGKKLRDRCAWYESQDHLPFEHQKFPDTEGAPRFSGARAAAMNAAMKRYGIKRFTRNRFGEYVDAEVNKRFPLEKQR